MPNTRSARLARWQIWLLTISGTLLWLSGAGWLLLHYYGQVQGEFGVETNPLEPWFLRVHGLVMIPALLGFGGMFIVHIPKGWKDKDQRVAGVALTAVMGVLILSGYLLYYLGIEWLRDWTSFIHWAIGLALPAIFVWHYLGRNAAKQKPRAKSKEV
jgi:hypothetical protein